MAKLREGRPELHALVEKALRAVVAEVGDPRRVELEDPYVFKATPSAPSATPSEGAEIPAVISPLPESTPFTIPAPYIPHRGRMEGEDEGSSGAQLLGDPDGDLL